MALAKKYISLNGELVGEINKVEGTRTDYLTDALGSVVGTFAQEESAPNHITVLNTYRYKPFGGLLVKTGSSPDPRYLWTGNSGSRYSARNYAEQYNWHRHYGHFQGQWTSRDILWPEESAFGYVNGNAISAIDSNGLQIQVIPRPHGAPGGSPKTGVVPNCCIANRVGVILGSSGKCVAIPESLISVSDPRRNCYIERCRLCSTTSQGNSGSTTVDGSDKVIGNNKGFVDVFDKLVGTLPSQGSSLCGLILSCIHRCPDEASKALGCWAPEGHHLLAPTIGLGCCVQAQIDLCCLFTSKIEFAKGPACRPQECPRNGKIGDPGINVDLMVANWDDPVYIGPGRGSMQGCLGHIIKQQKVLPPIHLGRR